MSKEKQIIKLFYHPIRKNMFIRINPDKKLINHKLHQGYISCSFKTEESLLLKIEELKELGYKKEG